MPLHPRDAEFGLPQWVFGMSTYGFAGGAGILCAYCEKGVWSLGLLDGNGRLDPIETPFTHVESVAVQGQRAVFRAASPSELPALVQMDLPSGEIETIRRSAAVPEGTARYFSRPRSVSFPTADGSTVHAFHYPPANPDHEALEGERPPLIVRLHGGPTAAASNALSLTTQFWTSRGFAVVDLNYGGSTGFGREYRERLVGQWGVVDVDDAVAAARHFSESKQADPRRLIAKGGSAGGFTVLCCLAFRDEFAAGTSYYGISDLNALARETHKFESRYHETLVGPWPASEELFSERSPLGAAHRISSPIVFFQGSEDRVVPKEQTETIVEALRQRGVPVAFHLFDGEAHGFRVSENIRRALEAELAFYRKMLLNMKNTDLGLNE